MYCKDQGQVNHNGTKRILAKSEHTAGCEARNGRKAVVDEGCQDITAAMTQFAEEHVNYDNNHRGPPEKMWNDTIAHF